MSDQPRAPNLSTSFRRDEIEVMCSIFAKASTKTDVAVLLRSAAALRIHRKFLGLRERARQEAIHGPEEAATV